MSTSSEPKIDQTPVTLASTPLQVTIPKLTRQNAYEYKHQVETCACGTCHKSRVDSGTQDAYLKRCLDASLIAIKNASSRPASGDAAIAIASAACGPGGGPGHPDFAKNLFAAMGTPHDSKCPHGLPFYACMPCSH